MPSLPTPEEQSAISCYILSKRQNAETIVMLAGLSVRKVESLIAKGERLIEQREDDES